MPTNKELFNSKMNALAVSINTKAGLTGKKDLDALKTAVDGITVGVDTSDATISSGGQLLNGVTAYGASGKVTGTIPTKTSSDLTVSGKTVTVPTGYYSSPQTKDVADGSATTPATTITANPTISVNSSTGVITASVSESQSVTPTVSAGYVASGTAGTVSVSGSATESLTTQAAATITPTSSAQTAVAAGKFTLGAVGVEAVVCTNLTAGNIKDGVTVKVGTATDDDSVLEITGTYEGGGTKPSYLISDGDSVSTFYFNIEYNLATVLAQMTYVTDPNTGYDVCEIGIGYFYAVNLGSSNYALVWNDGTIVPIYSTTAVPALGVTTAGWQVAFYAPSSSVTITLAEIEEHFAAILDNIVAKDDIAFGDFGRFWVGTQAQYDLLQTYDSNTYYCIVSGV